MTRLLATVAILPLALLLSGCDCLNAKAGTIKVDTDCGTSGALTHATAPFVSLPGGLAQSQVSKFLPAPLEPLVSELGCDALFASPGDIGKFCSPVGLGTTTGSASEPTQIDLGSLTDARVLMCGGKLVALGGGGGSLFVCTAEEAVVDGEVWFMTCQRFTSDPKSPTGTCQGVAEFDAIESVGAL